MIKPDSLEGAALKILRDSENLCEKCGSEREEIMKNGKVMLVCKNIGCGHEVAAPERA